MDTDQIIRNFTGTSLTQKILQDIVARGIEKKKRDLKIVGGFAFTLEKLCVCDRSCGGIMCRAINVFTLKGNSW